MMHIITNNQIKFLKSLKKRKAREEANSFLVEGIKLCDEILQSKFSTKLLVISETQIEKFSDTIEKYLKRNIPIFIAKDAAFEQFSDTQNPQGIVALASIKEMQFDLQSNFIVLDSVSDPGNLGTIIRTADWFGINNIFVFGDAVDVFNPKVVRSSMGSIFRINVVNIENNIDLVKKVFPNSTIFAASLDANQTIYQMQKPNNIGLVFGSESHGISPKAKSIVDEFYKIDTQSKAESLNLAVSVGISLFYFTQNNQ